MSTTTFKTSDKHRGAAKSLDLPTRLLLGPGPSNISPRVNLQLAQPMVGYMDPSYWKVMDETMELMRYLFQTDNQFTIPISGAGSAAMETCLSNLIEPGDVIVVGVSGYFSERICEMAQRYGADVRRVEAKWGTWLSHDDLSAAIQKHKPTLVAVVHGETSTGVRQGIEGLGKICHDAGALLMVDTVASLGGVPMLVDEWQVDACYTGGQKCLSGPPGISPLTFSPRAMERINKRKKPVANWYLDANMLASYWCPPPNTPRKYHHTTPANLLYCLRESLVVLAEEGIDNVWARHKASAEALYVALEEIGMHVLVCDDKGKDPSCAAGGRLHSLTSVRIPEGIDAPTIQKFLMENYGIEVAGGLGQLAGKIIRVGLMGYNSKVSNVKLLQTALKQCLDKHLKK